MCEGDITGKRKSTECQVSCKVGLFCLLDYLEYAMWVFVCLSLRSFKVEPSGNTARSVICVEWRWIRIGAATQHVKNVK